MPFFLPIRPFAAPLTFDIRPPMQCAIGLQACRRLTRAVAATASVGEGARR
jgi:hypothetical protein